MKESTNLEKMQNRNAKGSVLERLMAVPEDKKTALIEKYKIDGEMDEVLKHRHAIFVGTWFNRAVKSVEHGCTDAELNRMIDHLIVVINAGKYNLDITASADDGNILEIVRKYVHGTNVKMEERIYADRQTQLEHAAKKRGVLKLKKEGKTTQEIAEEMNLPESTVRFFLKNVEK